MEAYQLALAFVLVVGVLVFVHEMGHHLAARALGVRVERFSVGFGSPIARWTDRRGTEWVVGWVPLGGYVKLHGHEPPPAGAGGAARAAPMAGETFHDRPLRHRAAIVAAGPAANFLLAALLFAAVFAAAGRPYVEPRVTAVAEGGPAERAGMLPGDLVLEVAGRPVRTFAQMRAEVAPRPGLETALVVLRGAERIPLSAVPEDRGGKGYLSATLGSMAYERMDTYRALWAGAAFTVEASGAVLSSLWGMATGSRGLDELGGPIRIAQVSGEASQRGMAAMAVLIAFFSVNLGLLNLLPVPALDGGHLLLHAVEAARGRPVSARAADLCARCGVGCLMALMALATWNDLLRLAGQP